jgi:transposase
MRSGHAESFPQRVEELDLPETTRRLLTPLLTVIDGLTEQIEAADATIVRQAQGDQVCERLRTVPGIGPLTAVAFVATLDNVARFRDARQVRCYLGLVPSERSSGEQQRRGRITKCGNPRMRWLLVEAAWRLIRSQRPEAAELKAWATGLAGRRIAVVALARRLAGILYALWRDEAPFQVGHRRRRSPEIAA